MVCLLIICLLIVAKGRDCWFVLVMMLSVLTLFIVGWFLLGVIIYGGGVVICWIIVDFVIAHESVFLLMVVFFIHWLISKIV